MSVDELIERLAHEAEEGSFHTGVQVSVVVDGEPVVDLAVGRTHRHEPFTTDTLSALYCTGKPLLAVAALRLIADDEMSFDDRVGDILTDLDADWIAALTIEQLLGHTAGLHGLPSVIARVLPERSRWDWIRATPPPPGWQTGRDRAYSEFGGWFVLGRVVEALSDAPYERVVERAVLSPAGVSPDDLVIRFDPGRHGRERLRISATADLSMARPIPLLAEVGRETACEWNPAFGSYGNMRGLARFYAALLDDLDGAGRVVPKELLEVAVAPRPVVHDTTLGRDAGFGLGFMTPLSSHFFGPAPSARGFGHAGQGGSSFAFADPDRHMAVAVLANAGLDADTALGFRRAALVNSVYRAVSGD